MRKKAQAWYTDFMVGLLLFFAALTIYYLFQSSFGNTEEVALEDMISDAKQIANSLMSPGYPEGWSPATVERIGIVEDMRIDFDKLDDFISMDYNLTRSKFRTTYEYAIYFYDGNESIILSNNQTYIGLAPSQANKLVKITRMALYNSTLALIEVQVWQ
jgi:hypothetical protein